MPIDPVTGKRKRGRPSKAEVSAREKSGDVIETVAVVNKLDDRWMKKEEEPEPVVFESLTAQERKIVQDISEPRAENYATEMQFRKDRWTNLSYDASHDLLIFFERLRVIVCDELKAKVGGEWEIGFFDKNDIVDRMSDSGGAWERLDRYSWESYTNWNIRTYENHRIKLSVDGYLMYGPNYI